ncbi:MAG: hypothetical protein Q9182_004609 [Xanthomendoza sp. 2 TL-2023]
MLTSFDAFMPAPGGSAYQMSTLALMRHAEYLNLEDGAQGIVAYALHPGEVPTDLGLTTPKFLHAKPIDRPDLAADTIVYLDKTEFLQKREEIVSGDKLKLKLAT